MKVLKKIIVKLGKRSYPIIIGNGLISSKKIFDIDKFHQVCVITNSKINNLYGTLLPKKVKSSKLLINDGEKYKSLHTLEKIYSFLLKNNVSRDSCLVAFGGGVVGDIVGYAASTYMRGIKFIQVPTTLLSMVDSSVGGKTGVNHKLGKNMIGAFYQPSCVIVDLNTLSTLSKKQFNSGMAEVIKYGIIKDPNFFNWIIKNSKKIKNLDSAKLAEMIAKCCKIKADIVAKDEKEKNVRATLNLGHTFGHAIEQKYGFGKLTHGEAIACGTVIACAISVKMNLMKGKEFEKIKLLFKEFNLPIKLPKGANPESIYKTMLLDKKVLNGKLRLVIPKRIGYVKITESVNKSTIIKTLKEYAG